MPTIGIVLGAYTVHFQQIVVEQKWISLWYTLKCLAYTAGTQ